MSITLSKHCLHVKQMASQCEAAEMYLIQELGRDMRLDISMGGKA